MSILNHFGKVKASYKKYEGDLPEYTGYVFQESIEDNNYYKLNYKGVFIDPTNCNPQYFKTLNIPSKLHIMGSQNKPNHLNLHNYINNALSTSVILTDSYISSFSPETYVFSFTTLVETFSKCFEKVREKMYSDLWKTIECCPFINIMDLLILKQSDTDKHIEHVENMIRSLLDDNKLLQNRINALETQMKRNNIPVAVVVKTIGEELVYESV